MQVVSFSLGELQTNCYFIIQDLSCLIIDPVDSADFILEEVSRRGLEVKGLLATHGHFDHVLATGDLQASLGLPLYIFEEDIFLLKRVNETAEHFLGYNPQVLPPQRVTPLVEGNVSLGGFHFQVIKTPGHTPGSCSFYFKDEEWIFVGDLFFMGSVGRFDFSYSNKEQLKHSIGEIMQLPEATRVFSGHGEETLIQYEQQWKWAEVL